MGPFGPRDARHEAHRTASEKSVLETRTGNMHGSRSRARMMLTSAHG